MVISVLSRTQIKSHAYLAENITPYNEMIRHPWLPEQWNIFTQGGLALLDNELGRQAMLIGFLNDFHLIMLGALFSIPLVFFMVRTRE